MPKRKDYISWDEYFMGIALLAAKRSKDPNTQVGACIVNSSNKIMSIGYNGLPAGCDDDVFPWEREGENSYDTKYPYVCHAELNAILNNRGADLEGCSIYVALSRAVNVQRLSFKAESKRCFTFRINTENPTASERQKECLTPQESNTGRLKFHTAKL